jgi:hypothetical protein
VPDRECSAFECSRPHTDRLEAVEERHPKVGVVIDDMNRRERVLWTANFTHVGLP